MDWFDTVFEVIDMRSFSNLWYWIALAVLWSSVNHWIIGVPFDMITRARRKKSEEAITDLQDMVRINVNRILFIAETSGSWMVLFGSTLVTAMGIAAFVYMVEFAQSVFLLVIPMMMVGAISIRTAKIIRNNQLEGDALIKRLLRHRFSTQALGVIAIFVTAMFGMYQNLYTGPFGGF